MTAQAGVVDHIGGVEPAAEPDFEQQDIGRALREEFQRRRRGRLEKGDRRPAIGLFDFGERFAENIVFHQPAAAWRGEPDALAEGDEMRRGIDVNADAGGLQDGPHEGDGRALAVGAGDMDDRRQALLRIAERGEQALDALQRQVDPLGMQLEQARQQRVTRRHVGTSSRLDRREPWSAGGRGGPESRAFRRAERPDRPCRAGGRYSARWNPSGRRSRMVCSITRAPAKPITAPGSAMWMSPSMA